jgi:o-succinylbenzoate---CoA ligase
VEVRDLIALLLPAGPRFVEEVRRAWENGDAVLPLDPSAPESHTASLIESLGPTIVVDRSGERTPRSAGRPVEQGDAVVVATSGTSGEPKGAVHTHDGIRHAAYSTSLAANVGPDSRWLACLPLSHVGGFSVIARALITGTALEVHARFDAAAVDRAARSGATHVSLVPTAFSRVDPSPWHTILLGGSAIPVERPPNTIATYGMTETFGGVVYDGLAVPGTRVRITGPDDDEVRTGEEGTVELRTPSMMRCYRDGGDTLTSDGWFRTGDLGLIEPLEQRLVVLGRSDDLIITGGEKVWPEPVERLLDTQPGIREAAVIGVPDNEWGQRVVALVVPESGSPPPDLDRIRDAVRSRLPVASAPKELRLVDSLPRTGLGKIRRSSLPRGDQNHA